MHANLTTFHDQFAFALDGRYCFQTLHEFVHSICEFTDLICKRIYTYIEIRLVDCIKLHVFAANRR